MSKELEPPYIVAQWYRGPDQTERLNIKVRGVSAVKQLELLTAVIGNIAKENDVTEREVLEKLIMNSYYKDGLDVY